MYTHAQKNQIIFRSTFFNKKKVGSNPTFFFEAKIERKKSLRTKKVASGKPALRLSIIYIVNEEMLTVK